MKLNFKKDGDYHEVWSEDNYHLLGRIVLSKIDSRYIFTPTRTSNFKAEHMVQIGEYMKNMMI
jgi:hypothetical protein